MDIRSLMHSHYLPYFLLIGMFFVSCGTRKTQEENMVNKHRTAGNNSGIVPSHKLDEKKQVMFMGLTVVEQNFEHFGQQLSHIAMLDTVYYEPLIGQNGLWVARYYANFAGFKNCQVTIIEDERHYLGDIQIVLPGYNGISGSEAAKIDYDKLLSAYTNKYGAPKQGDPSILADIVNEYTFENVKISLDYLELDGALIQITYVIDNPQEISDSDI